MVSGRIKYVMLWKGQVAYTKPQKRKKEDSERLRGEKDQIKFVDIRFERFVLKDKQFKSLHMLFKLGCLKGP